jgi:ATP-dependent Clp protease ATP-binding subunit ClpC
MGFHTASAEQEYGRMKDRVMEEAKKVFNPEFLNRIDEIIVFRSLEKSHIESIVEILLDQVRGRLAEQEMAMTVTPEALALLIEQGFDPDLGARPLRRAIQKLIEDPLAELVLKGRIRAGSLIQVTRKGNEIAVEEHSAFIPTPEVTHQE